MTFHKYCLQ